MPTRRVRLILVGVGNIGRAFLKLLIDKRQSLMDRYGLELALVAAADSSGAVLDPASLDPAELLALKASGRGVAQHPKGGIPKLPAAEAVSRSAADVLLEASPTNLVDGQPGLGAIEAALAAGMHVVSANKGPLVLAYPQLSRIARERGVALRHSAAVAGACPTVNVGQRDLVGCEIKRVEGILNMTTNFILCRMTDGGLTFAEALAEAQALGIAEADPSLDVDGWDAANKLVIIANSVLNMPATLKDVEVAGIRGLPVSRLSQTKAEGGAIKLLALAEKGDDGYKLSVKPTLLPLSHPLAQLGPGEMGIVYHTDTQGVIRAIADEQSTTSTAAAMLRDLINIYYRP